MTMHDDRPEGTRLSRRALLCRGAALGAGALLARTAAPGIAFAAEPDAMPATPAAALARLAEGNARFRAGKPRGMHRDMARLREIAPKQTPFAAFLGCADSRVPIELAYDQGFGDLFTVRVAGNIATAVEIASLEFGTEVLGCEAIVVLGHSGCGAVQAALAGGEVPGQISTLYQHIVPAFDRPGMPLAEAIVANVRFQARKLRTSPVIAKLAADGRVVIAGGVFDIATGRVDPVDV
jgi:carbonic anhydrase